MSTPHNNNGSPWTNNQQSINKNSNNNLGQPTGSQYSINEHLNNVR